MKRFNYSAIILLAVLFSSCIYDDLSECRSSIELEIQEDRTPPTFFKHVVYDYKGGFQEQDLNADLSTDHTDIIDFNKRFIVEVYRTPISKVAPIDKPIARQIVIKESNNVDKPVKFNIDIPTGDYSALVWCDYLPKNTSSNWYFNTESLFAITEKLDCNINNNHLKDALVGRKDFVINPGQYTQQKLQSTATRPSSRIRVVANDLKEFQQLGGDINGLQIKIVYNQFISVGYNVSTQQPNKFIQTRSFITKPNALESDQSQNIQLALDYILTSTGKEDCVMADVYVFDKDDKKINHYTDLKIPLMRNQETIVSGPFLTQENGDGGISIDDTFDDEHIVIIK